MKKISPTYIAKNIFEIDLEFYKKIGVKYIFTDLDNTLDSYKQKEPTEKVINLVKELNKNDLILIICSNNSNKRVSKYAKILGVNFMYYSNKPSIKKLSNYLEINNINVDECIFIGDQLVTDIKTANRIKMKSIYVDDLVKENGFFTRFNKFYEKSFLKFISDFKNTKDWRDI